VPLHCLRDTWARSQHKLFHSFRSYHNCHKVDFRSKRCQALKDSPQFSAPQHITKYGSVHTIKQGSRANQQFIASGEEGVLQPHFRKATRTDEFSPLSTWEESQIILTQHASTHRPSLNNENLISSPGHNRKPAIGTLCHVDFQIVSEYQLTRCGGRSTQRRRTATRSRPEGVRDNRTHIVKQRGIDRSIEV
jgi:hypothetical protein